mmetsp:Transcript_11653/g.32906  ORF Transcript_11653/g.32906 Transcript_11653/m.32906 type:complete len:212 (+) Transcript_11653:2142-2777(+)
MRTAPALTSQTATAEYVVPRSMPITGSRSSSLAGAAPSSFNSSSSSGSFSSSASTSLRLWIIPWLSGSSFKPASKASTASLSCRSAHSAAPNREWPFTHSGARRTHCSASSTASMVRRSLRLEADRLEKKTWSEGSSSMAAVKCSTASNHFSAVKASLPLALCSCALSFRAASMRSAALSSALLSPSLVRGRRFAFLRFWLREMGIPRLRG